MERVFSVDDILGTFWKLDTQGDPGSGGSTGGGGGGGGGGFSGSYADLQKLQREGSLTGSLPRSASVHRMSRSSSEWAFQEFLKEHVAATGGLERAGSLSSLGERSGGGGVPQSASMESLDKLGSPDQERAPNGDLGSPPAGSSMGPPAAIAQATSGRARLSPPQYAAAVDGSTAAKMAVDEPPMDFLPPGQVSGERPDSEGQYRMGMTVEAQGGHRQQGVAQAGVQGGVRPLFSGLHEEPPPASHQEYEDMLKHRLAVACAMASTRVSLGSH